MTGGGMDRTFSKSHFRFSADAALRTFARRSSADHVIAEMVSGLGGWITALEAPFDPEFGAYAGTPHRHADDDTHQCQL